MINIYSLRTAINMYIIPFQIRAHTTRSIQLKKPSMTCNPPKGKTVKVTTKRINYKIFSTLQMVMVLNFQRHNYWRGLFARCEKAQLGL
jgi:hypothetical protein